MPDPERPRFHLRLTPELDRLLVQTIRKTGRSKNSEILRALEWHLQPDPARQLAEAVQPLLDELTDEQCAQFVGAVEAMQRGIVKKKRRR